MYAVSSNPGCTVINGDMAVDIPAGGQSVILALDKKLIIDGDDNAKFVEVRWGTNAAIGSRPIPWMGDVVDGLYDILVDIPFDINYLPVENKLVVHTDRASDELSEEVTELLASVVPQDVEVVRYNFDMAVSWRDAEYKYADVRSEDDLKARYPNYAKDITSAGWWVYSFLGWSVGLGTWSLYSDKVKHIRSSMPKVPSIWYGWHGNKNLLTLEVPTPKCKTFDQFAQTQPKLYHFRGDFSSATKFTNSFTEAVLDKASALHICEILPTWTDGKEHLFQYLSVHIDLINDADIATAISNAEDKGWTITLRGNGTPTAQASTFNMGQLIYAKVGEMENPDGTTEQYLDWGHYVTNWEERGYEQFRSLESAYEYFGLEMPESETEEELQIEEIENA